MRCWTAGWVACAALLAANGALQAADGETQADSAWSLQLYVDAGYALSDNKPGNHRWRSKGTTSWLDEPELFLGMGNVTKQATSESRWGFEFGLQTGRDSEAQVPSSPPIANEPIDNADDWRHLYRANVSYLFDAGRGLRLTGGLINSPIGYESYLAIDNPNYTRGYILDNVPYFLVGLEAVWDVSPAVDLGFYLVTGAVYLADPNDVPSPGFQLKWKVSPHMTFTQNLFYGAEQRATELEYWGVLTDSILEWRRGDVLLAGAVDYGQERQAALAGQPLQRWGSAAFWAQWQVSRRLSLAVRPEVYWDPDGRITGARQTLQAVTGTLKYEYSPKQHRLVGTLEVRFDRSTGDDGGFYEGPDNRLVPEQWLMLAGVLWSFDGWP